MLPFHGDTLITEITGREIEWANFIHTKPDGTLAGAVKVGGKTLPFEGNTLITHIAGRVIEEADDIHTQTDGTLAGKVQVGGVQRNFYVTKDGRSGFFPL
jgi:hypothetical protein